MWKPIWDLINRESRSRYQTDSRVLTDAQQRISQDLDQNGIAITSLDELFPGKNLLQSMQEEAKRLEATATPNAKKTFLTQLIQLYPQLDLQDIFVRFGLSNEVLGCVSSYLERWPKLYYYTLGITQPVEEGMAPRQSQRWHRDPEDRKMCKVFIYLTDVDEGCGPFTYIKKSTRDRQWGGIYMQKPPAGYYPPEGAVERMIPSSEVQVCTGKAGTVIFADTSGLHKGGYATHGRRVMSTTGFVTQACVKGVFYTRGEDFQSSSTQLSPIATYALDNQKIANRNWKY